jgi:hypothetical protein
MNKRPNESLHANRRRPSPLSIGNSGARLTLNHRRQRRSVTSIVKAQPMVPLRSIVKGTLNGALLFAVIGIFVGAVVAIIIWPGSNLGPPVGMVYGFFWGALVGVVLGFVYAIIRLYIWKPPVAHEYLDNHKAP